MKKFMTILATLAVALMLVGCGLGKGLTSGTKWKKKMTVNGTNITTTYRRFIKPLSISKKVSAIKTTIAIDTEKSTLTSVVNGKDKNAVVGLAFDFHQSGTTANPVYDFVLIGFAPATHKFYIEKYENVSKEGAKGADSAIDEGAEDLGNTGFDTNEDSMAAYKSFTGSIGSMTLSEDQVENDWKDAPEDSYEENGDNGYEFYVQIKQTTKGTYTIYLGDTLVATYQGDIKDTDGKTCIGKAAVYANSPKGTKVVATYISDKTETVGLFADEEEY